MRQFLSILDSARFEPFLAKDFVDSQVSLEEPYELDGLRKDIDIQVLILDEHKNERHRLIIENKVKSGAARATQLAEYYAAVVKDEADLDDLTFIFLTPDSTATQLHREFENLTLTKQGHEKFWIHWSSSGKCVVRLIREILSLEGAGEINPINEYMRHTLKTFAMHCSSITDINKQKVMRTGEDIGEIVDEAEIETESGRFKVLRRDSSQIQVFNLNTGDKEVARHVLAEFIDENGLDIPYEHYNTRTIGKKFFEWKNES